MTMNQQEQREAALAVIGNGMQRANDMGYQSDATFQLYAVLAMVEIGRILAGIEAHLEIANDMTAQTVTRP